MFVTQQLKAVISRNATLNINCELYFYFSLNTLSVCLRRVVAGLPWDISHKITVSSAEPLANTFLRKRGLCFRKDPLMYRYVQLYHMHLIQTKYMHISQPQVKGFKYLWDLFTSGRKSGSCDWKMNWCSMFKSVVVKRDQSGKAKLSAYWLTCFPTLTYDKKQG